MSFMVAVTVLISSDLCPAAFAEPKTISIYIPIIMCQTAHIYHPQPRSGICHTMKSTHAMGPLNCCWNCSVQQQ